MNYVVWKKPVPSCEHPRAYPLYPIQLPLPVGMEEQAMVRYCPDCGSKWADGEDGEDS